MAANNTQHTHQNTTLANHRAQPRLPVLLPPRLRPHLQMELSGLSGGPLPLRILACSRFWRPTSKVREASSLAGEGAAADGVSLLAA